MLAGTKSVFLLATPEYTRTLSAVRSSHFEKKGKMVEELNNVTGRWTMRCTREHSMPKAATETRENCKVFITEK